MFLTFRVRLIVNRNFHNSVHRNNFYEQNEQKKISIDINQKNFNPKKILFYHLKNRKKYD